MVIMTNIFKERICTYIKENELNPTSFSKAANIASSVTHNIINSKNPNPTIETAIKIANSMNCSLDELCGTRKVPPIKELDLLLTKSICEYICCIKEIQGISFDDFCEVTLQIYNYCQENKLKTVDPTYAKWYIKKVYKNGVL